MGRNTKTAYYYFCQDETPSLSSELQTRREIQRELRRRWKELRSSSVYEDRDRVRSYVQKSQQIENRINCVRAHFRAFLKFSKEYRPFIQDLFEEWSPHTVTQELMRQWKHLPSSQRKLYGVLE